MSRELDNFLRKKNLLNKADKKTIKNCYNALHKTNFKSCEEITTRGNWIQFCSVIETLFQQGTFIKPKYSFNQKRLISVEEQRVFLKKKGII